MSCIPVAADCRLSVGQGRRNSRVLLLALAILLTLGLSGAAAQTAICAVLRVGDACLDDARRSNGGAYDGQPLGARVPLVLIHGWNPETIPGLPDGTIWDNWLTALVRESTLIGRIKPYVFTYYSNVASVVEIGTALRDVLDRKGERDEVFGISQVLVVAHSMGGLVARYAMTLPSTRGPLRGSPVGSRLRALITLGTPHHGSMLANGPAMGVRVGSAFASLWNQVNGLFFAFGSPDWWQLNRTDLYWDNYDNALDYSAPYSAEQNHFLETLNATSIYDDRIIAYGGTLDICIFLFNKYCAFDALIQGVFSTPTDGVVPISSALFYSRDGTPRVRWRRFAGYDHSQIARGGVDLTSSDSPFAALKSDLLEATSPVLAGPPNISGDWVTTTSIDRKTAPCGTDYFPYVPQTGSSRITVIQNGTSIVFRDVSSNSQGTINPDGSFAVSEPLVAGPVQILFELNGRVDATGRGMTADVRLSVTGTACSASGTFVGTKL